MPPTVTKITFPNNREATAVFPLASTTGAEIVEALGVRDYKAVILLIGGADSVAENVKARLTQLFGRGIARAAASVNAVVVDGGTAAGVMQMMGQGVADRGYKSSLIGVAPLGLVNFPGSEGGGETPLDPNHSHFVLVEGTDWGSETGVIYKLVSALTSNKTPAVVLLVGGGAVSKNEALQAVRQSLPLFVVEGSGGLADEIATAWKARPELPDDPAMAEIIADGRIEFHQLTNSVKGAERLILRELGGDNVLLQAWEQFADYDLNAGIQQRKFNRLQIAIIVIGILGTGLAITKEVFNHDGVKTALKDWWFYWPTSAVLTPNWVGWWVIYYLLIVLPIVLTILITAANRFKQGNKWLLLRAGAEAIKREIYRYRVRAGDYKESPRTPSTTPSGQAAQPGTPPVAPTGGSAAQPTTPPTPAQVLAQRVEDITRRTMRTEVNTSAVQAYNKDYGFPPYMYAAKGGDDGFSLLSPDRYVEVRLGDQLNYFRKKTGKLERQLRVIQWSIFIIGGLGTLLAAINQQVWIAVTTALAAALTTYLSYQQTEASLTKYNQAATNLANVKAWWNALPAADQDKPDNIDTLVKHTEQVLESELDGWVQQMQNALVELRKSQASQDDDATGKPTGNGGGGAGGGGGGVNVATVVVATPANVIAVGDAEAEAAVVDNGAAVDDSITDPAANAAADSAAAVEDSTPDAAPDIADTVGNVDAGSGAAPDNTAAVDDGAAATEADSSDEPPPDNPGA